VTLEGEKTHVDILHDQWQGGDGRCCTRHVVRDHLSLTGTKFGCGGGLCGACTVHIDGKATRSCQTAVSQVSGKKITTIEGLGR
jgi:aerobic-type carbon monoxide dehydrogenase small subunit (CoxS/CutS family)